MKQKKRWMLPLCVIGGLLLICAGLLWYMVSHSMDFPWGAVWWRITDRICSLTEILPSLRIVWQFEQIF